MSINVHFTDEDWRRMEKNWSAWWAGELDRPMVMIDNPLSFSLPMELSQEFLLEKPVDEVLDHFQTILEFRQFYGDAWPKWWPDFGPGIMAGFLGANVHGDPEMTTVWFDAPDERPIDKLHFRYGAENIWWKRILDVTRGAIERWGNSVSVAHTDLGGNLDILASFRTTQQLLLDLYDAPEEVLRLAHEITALWIRYYDELDSIIQTAGRGTTPWAPIWSPKRCYMLQSDFSFMISPEMFKRFILPDLAACCDKMEHAFYHLDGPGEIRHLDTLLSLENLKGIQWIPGDGSPPPEEWLPLLKRIRDAGKLCQVFVEAEGARTIVRELGGKGFAFYIMSFINSAEEANDFLNVLAKDDRGSWK
jgi:5-methyltetrahydrofolate--homocysteine methyltransferase